MLKRTVNSLLKARKGRGDIEIVVVEEGDMPQKIEGVKYIFLPRKNLGLGYARNTGVKNASGDIILFTDDDVVVDENWIDEMIRGFQYGDGIYGVAGLTRTLIVKWFNGVEEILGLPGGGIKWLYWSGNKIVPAFGMSGCNMGFRKEVFDEFSFIEHSFGKYGGDDWYLSTKVREKYKCVFNPSAVVYHQPKNKLTRLMDVYFRRQICDYLAKRDLYGYSKFYAVFGKLFQCVIIRFFVSLVIIVIFGFKGLLFVALMYYILSLVSIIKFLRYIEDKRCFFIYPFVKFITELGIFKGELCVLFSKDVHFDKILERY